MRIYVPFEREINYILNTAHIKLNKFYNALIQIKYNRIYCKSYEYKL